MTELIINIAPEKEQLIKMLVEELGGEVIAENSKVSKTKAPAKKSKSKNSKKKEKKVSPTFLFGKWKDFDIDARKLREETWGRKY